MLCEKFLFVVKSKKIVERYAVVTQRLSFHFDSFDNFDVVILDGIW